MTIDTIEEKIKSTPALMLYFSGESCGVCEILKPRIFEAFKTNYPKIEKLELSVEEHKSIAAHFSVFAMPTIIIFFEGKEFFKKSRNLSVDGFIAEVNRPYNLFFGE
jgi:thioredoxin-like negative regulator of GroEL